MCTYYYLHHHHTEACGRAIDIVVHYVFCAAAAAAAVHTYGNGSSISTSTPDPGVDDDTATNVSTTTSGSVIPQSPDSPLTQVPCGNLYFDPSQSVDYNNPCATGGCLASPDCTSGACRLLQLNGHWKCCRCRRGGNRYRWCRHRMRQSPDTFCYHVCCMGCVPDDTAEAEP